MTYPTIDQIGEISLVDDIRRRFGRKDRNIAAGIGDDAAVIKLQENFLLATTDMMVEGVHFDLRFVTAYQLGFKLISVNVSDIFAMGGIPRYVLLNIALRKQTTAEFVRFLLNGVEDALKLYHIVLVGGDLSSAKRGICLSATLIGSARKYIRRSGARVGDGIYVTGTLGESSCGLSILKKMKKPIPIYLRNTPSDVKSAQKEFGRICAGSPLSSLSWETAEPLIRRHLLPEARNSSALARHATAMIDISDGLLIDLTRLCNESGTGARVYEEKIPLSAGVRKTASFFGMDPLKAAMTGGEDYELLFTAPKGTKVRATHIGDVTESRRIVVSRTGEERPFSTEGYEHFH